MKTKCLLLFILLPFFLEGQNLKPFVIPELKEWKGGQGGFSITEKTRIVISSNNKELLRIAHVFSDDYRLMLNLNINVIEGKPKAGDIIFSLKPDKQLGKEGYQIKIEDKIEITAPNPIGLFWATRTILQMSEQSKDISKGIVRDFPDYQLRGFMIDCGRKFIPMHFLRDYVKFMAYYKMNTFQIHLNDNGFKSYFGDNWDNTYSAFRLESETYPELTAEDGHYSKQEFIDLQILAENNFVDIIPEIDVPAHSLAFAHYLPELGSDEYGKDHLDLFNPKTYEFLDGLFDEYLKGDNPVFRGKNVHVGTDEYSNKKKEVVEKFRYFTDYYIKYVEKYDKKAWVWGALTHARGETPVKSENVTMQIWHNPYAQPDSMLQEGYELVSIPDGLLYIVPNAGYYYNYLNNKSLYDTWTPNVIGKRVFEERHPKIAGGMFAVWNDEVGNGITSKDIHHRVLPSMQTLAVKMWTGSKTSLDFEQFDIKRQVLSEAPGVNISGKIKGIPNSLVYELPTVEKDIKIPYNELGYDYSISFDIEVKKEDKGTVLFSSRDVIFYLSDPIRGHLGFACEGYLSTFDYGLKDKQKVNITISGNSEETCLLVNGKVRKVLSPRVLWFDKEGKKDMKIISTLVFPLQKQGNFKSRISNLRIYNYCIHKM